MKAELIKIKEEAEGIKTFILEPDERITFIAGQYSNFTIENNGKKLTHAFSISCAPGKETISFTTIISESEYKQTLNRMKEGDEIEFNKPNGTFTLDQSTGKDVVFLAGGIGITHVKSMIDFTIENKLDKEITLFYANKTISRIVFKKELDEVDNKNGRIRVVDVLSQEESAPIGSETGRINMEIIQKYLGEVASKQFYLVGPPSFVEAMEQLLKDLHIPKNNIIKESFSGY